MILFKLASLGVLISVRSLLVLFTKGRDHNTSSHSRGGGVLIAVTKYPYSKMLIVGDYNIHSSLPPDDSENLLYNNPLLSEYIQTTEVGT